MDSRNYNKISNNEDLLKDDFKFLLNLIYKFLRFVVVTPFRLLLIFLFYLFNSKIVKKQKVLIIKDFKDLFLYPVKWFFAAKTTLFLCFIMIIIFILQIFYLDNFGIKFATYPQDLFNLDRYYTFITSIFLHGGTLHLISNLLALLIFGRKVERKYGFNMFFIFLFSGIIANVISSFISVFILNSNIPGWGASGGIAGLIMLSVLLEPFSVTLYFGIPLPYFLLGWFLIYSDFAARNLNDGVGHYTHLGGYFGVLLFVLFFQRKNKKELIEGLIINLFMLFLFILINSFYGFSLFSFLFNR